VARRKKPAAPENHERWLVSYADFITLLFAFFVVMFASSQADKTKAKRFAEAMTDALENGSAARNVAAILRGKVSSTDDVKEATPDPAESSEQDNSKNLSESLHALAKELQAEINAGKISITMEPRGLVVSLQEAAFFPSGDDKLLSGALPSIQKIASIIKKLPNKIRLEGHTDAVPISNSRFRSNWELSSARGIAVLDWLSASYGIPAARMAVTAYADTVPKAANDTDEGRARNRRVDITILKEKANSQEPRAESPVGDVNARTHTSRNSKT
jgi:chemotaxis protein MotB